MVILMRSPREDKNWHARIKFAISVEEARMGLGLTQQELGRAVGINAEKIDVIETQGVGMGSRFFEPLCDLLGLEVESFGFAMPRKRRRRCVENELRVNQKDGGDHR